MRLTKGFCSCLCSYCLWDGKEGQFLHHQKNKPGLAEQRVGDAWLLSYWVGEISILSAVSPLERSPLAPEGFCRLTCGSWPAREEGQWMAEWEWHQGMGSGEPGEGFHSCCCWSKGHWCALKDGIVLRGTSCGCSTVLDAGLFFVCPGSLKARRGKALCVLLYLLLHVAVTPQEHEAPVGTFGPATSVSLTRSLRGMWCGGAKVGTWWWCPWESPEGHQCQPGSLPGVMHQHWPQEQDNIRSSPYDF